MNNQATKKLSLVPESTPTETEKHVIMSEPRKKIQKLTHSNTTDGESTVDKMTTEMQEVTFVQTKMACACGSQHTITLSDDGTVHSFGRNEKGELGLGHDNDVSLPTPAHNYLVR